MNSPDSVCKAYANKDIKIRCRSKERWIEIEGSKKSLEFIGKLILAQAKYKNDCGFQISPYDGGNRFFAPHAKKGLYIHRLPCKK